MQQEQSSEHTSNHQEGEDPQAKVGLIWSVTGTAIPIWIFLIVLFFLWILLPDYIPDGTDRAKVFLESMFSLAIVIVVVVHAVMYYKQAKEANRQAQSSAQLIELMVLTELPYMRIGEWKPPRICEKGRLHIKANLRNSGRTMAWNIATGCPPVRIGQGVRGSLPLIPRGEETWITYGALDSKESMVIEFKGLEVSDEQAAQLQAGKLNIFVDGVCRYQDSMGGKSYYTYGYTLNYKRNITPRYERHHRVKANPNYKTLDDRAST